MSSPQEPRGARSPHSSASRQRGAHKHQRSPGLRPGKPNWGIGVERSLPEDLENSRNAAVMTAQTVWLPRSSGLVLQQPSRKNPDLGIIEQTSSLSPRTFRGALEATSTVPAVVPQHCRLLGLRHAPPGERYASEGTESLGATGQLEGSPVMLDLLIDVVPEFVPVLSVQAIDVAR